MRDWQSSSGPLTDQATRHAYVGRCLSALGVPSSPRRASEGLLLYADQTRAEVVGLCLVVDDVDIGRTTQGKHYQAILVRELRRAGLIWGILTNGAHWRLCRATAPAPYEVYLQADMDAILDAPGLTDFSIFYSLFSGDAFGGDADATTLDRHLEASDLHIEAVQRYLRRSVEQVLSSLCRGFVVSEGHRAYDRKMLDEIYRNAIYLLYRILFISYAEARDLLPTGDPRYRAKGLASLAEDARLLVAGEGGGASSYALWSRLDALCEIVDRGEPTLEIAAYNGGLFSDEEKPYLDQHRIADVYLAPVLSTLGYMEERGEVRVIDYRDLSVRHLGTLYEGLLEYRLHVVDKEQVVARERDGRRTYTPLSAAGHVAKGETILAIGQVYFADDRGERKGTGSYYTPEDVVTYIVDGAVAPQIEERCAPVRALVAQALGDRAAAPTPRQRRSIERYADEEIRSVVEERLLRLRILDMAMGSAHFLVAAAQALTNAIVETLCLAEWAEDNEDGAGDGNEEMPSLASDPLVWKRRVVERCLYGVDVNPLALELAKLALWLSSASKGKPLTFLDHHLKVGDALRGVLHLTDLAALPTSARTGQADLFQPTRHALLAEARAEIDKITSTDSERIGDVKDKDVVNRRAAEIRRPLSDIANVWLATFLEPDAGVAWQWREDAYDGLIRDAKGWDDPALWDGHVKGNELVMGARQRAKDRGFFHWEVEFSDAVQDDRIAFDVVIGNPPYVGGAADAMIEALFATAKSADTYAWMVERALTLAGEEGSLGLIVPLSLTFSRQMTPLRSLILRSQADTRIASFDATRDGIFPPSEESRNGQRASILIQRKGLRARRLLTTDMMRWLGEERAALLPSLRYADVTPLATDATIPKIGDDRLVAFWEQARHAGKPLGKTLYRAPKTAKDRVLHPPPLLSHLYLSGSARYFITAMPTAVRDTGLQAFAWADPWTRDVALLALNSDVFYWLWCALGDGFHVTRDVAEAMVLPSVAVDDPETMRLRDALLAAAPACVTYHSKWGQGIPNYNFNKRMDILRSIDAWLIGHLAPDAPLSPDTFSRYKSNSFLRPSEAATTGMPTEDATE